MDDILQSVNFMTLSVLFIDGRDDVRHYVGQNKITDGRLECMGHVFRQTNGPYLGCSKRNQLEDQ